MRIACGVEYDGSRFNGWQTQKADARTVQETLEAGLSKVANHPVAVSCAGRTDTGVHGRGQVIHFDTDADRSMRSWVLGTNVNTPRDVGLLWAVPVSDDFHARFKARGRAYRYEIINRAVRSPLWVDRATWIHRPLDVERMRAAAPALIGEHDFTAYRTVHCQAHSPVRQLRRLDITRDGERVFIDVEANGFLHHMVRNIAGVLIAIGVGDQPVAWAGEVLALRDRRLGGVTAPSDGLYFQQVDYDPIYGLPALTASCSSTD